MVLGYEGAFVVTRVSSICGPLQRFIALVNLWHAKPLLGALSKAGLTEACIKVKRKMSFGLAKNTGL